jgi:glycosyltransferase involved in cell wall biosynthesis
MTNSNPLISVIVPNYNHEIYLDQRISSILDQTYSNIEIILLDDASSDNSQKKIYEYADNEKVKQIIINKVNSGSPFHQWQKGISFSTGKYIWIAESDDFCSPLFLENVFQFIDKQNEHISVILCNSFDVNENGKILRSRNYYYDSLKDGTFNNDFSMKGDTFLKNYMCKKCVIPNTSAVIFERKIIEESGIDWQEINKYRICGDWLFWSLLLKKCNIGFLSTELNMFRTHTQTTRNQNTIHKSTIRFKEEMKIRKKMGIEYNYLSKNILINVYRNLKVIYGLTKRYFGFY